MPNRKWTVREYDLGRNEVDVTSWQEETHRVAPFASFVRNPGPKQILKWVYSIRGYDSVSTSPMPQRLSFEQTIRRNPSVPAKLFHEIEDKLIEVLDPDTTEPCKLLERAGLPDLLVYKQRTGDGNSERDTIANLDDYRFIEVKSERDKLTHSQIDWITQFGFLPVKVAYVIKEAVEDLFRFQDRLSGQITQ